MVRSALAASLLALALLPASALATPSGTTPTPTPMPTPAAEAVWATVNVCDTAKRPDTIGIRAAMPGVPRGAALFMRFQVQYKAGGGWQQVKGTDSRWRPVGRGHGTPVESGWSFSFAQPAAPVTLRGDVRFQWRRQGTVLASAEAFTEAGHRSSAGADPAGYSAATCTLGG